MKIDHKPDVAAKRRQQYPPVGDQLDAILKQFAALPRAQLVPEMAALIDQVAAVKTRTPMR